MSTRNFGLLTAFLLLSGCALAADKQILLIAGPPSHGPGEHEQNAGVALLAGLVNKIPGYHATTTHSAWPDKSQVERADAIFIFCDGGDRHMAVQADHAAQLDAAAKRGAGIMLYHYCVEPPEKTYHQEFLNWIGGYFEVNYSINPTWVAEYKSFPKHPIANGVKPFALKDEWYYNMRFQPDPKGLTQILVATPGPDTLTRKDGPHEGNPEVRKKLGQPECMMWAYVRPDGGRGVGFTGGHYHTNLGDDNFRKLVLNAIVWSAKGKVPKNGIMSTVSADDLKQNLDDKPIPANRKKK